MNHSFEVANSRCTLLTRMKIAAAAMKLASGTNKLIPQHSKSKSRRPSRRKRTVLSSETLEPRNMNASIAVNGNVLYIVGDDQRNDNAFVEADVSFVKVVIASRPEGNPTAPATFTRGRFANSSFSRIEFYGHGGNDSFSNFVSNKPVSAWGGEGDDRLSGGNADDDLYGGSGNDTLKGFAGNDGLYGGGGVDELFGQEGSDRFLDVEGQSEAKDLTAQDALLQFRNGTRNWTRTEIEQVDKGLKALHQRTRNDKLLETSNSPTGRIVFVREISSGELSGVNLGDGTIKMYDRAFTSGASAALTTVHEIAHNWDTEQGVNQYNGWRGLSGWRNTAPSRSDASKYIKSPYGENWWYLKTSQFAREYGKRNPMEDWSTSWESYFAFKNGISGTSGLAQVQAKFAHLDAFFARMT